MNADQKIKVLAMSRIHFLTADRRFWFVNRPSNFLPASAMNSHNPTSVPNLRSSA
jgi:hypothetical protein